MSQLILFDDSGVVVDAHDVDNSYYSTGKDVFWGNGVNFMFGINHNFGLFPDGTAKIGDSLTLAQYMPVAQANKIEELDQNCTNCIYTGFDCQPLGDGITYHFPFDDQAQKNYNQYLTDVLFGDADSYGWKVQDSAGNWSALTLTPDQFKNNVRPVASSFKMAQITQYRTLADQVEAAQDLTTLNKVIWVAATY